LCFFIIIIILPSRARKIRVGYADTIGRRLTMEDMIVIKRNFRNRPDEDLLAVFDGHGGRDASEFCGVFFFFNIIYLISFFFWLLIWFLIIGKSTSYISSSFR
jgi:serine/threonine protein phosphatase PrpC